MPHAPALRCRHAFESATVHANGEVVCSIIDGRGEFVLGNVHQQSLPEILAGPRSRELRRLMRSTPDAYCAAIGKRCPLKSIVVAPAEDISTRLRFLSIEPTTACDLRCLSCPVRDFSGDVTWRDAFRDGGASFAVWGGPRRQNQQAADGGRRPLPMLGDTTPADRGRLGAMLLRGRIPKTRRG